MSQHHREKQLVLVNVILDKSGSMASKLNDVIEGFNAYVTGLGEEKTVNYLFSLTLFDTQVAHRRSWTSSRTSPAATRRSTTRLESRCGRSMPTSPRSTRSSP